MVFGKQISILFVPRVVSVVASIACAVIWRSYWALVVGILVVRGLRLVFTYVIHPVSAAHHAAGVAQAGWLFVLVLGDVDDRAGAGARRHRS